MDRSPRLTKGFINIRFSGKPHTLRVLEHGGFTAVLPEAKPLPHGLVATSAITEASPPGPNGLLTPPILRALKLFLGVKHAGEEIGVMSGRRTRLALIAMKKLPPDCAPHLRRHIGGKSQRLPPGKPAQGAGHFRADPQFSRAAPAKKLFTKLWRQTSPTSLLVNRKMPGPPVFNGSTPLEPELIDGNLGRVGSIDGGQKL